MNINEFNTILKAGAFDPHLDHIIKATKARREAIAPSLKPGDPVVFNHLVRPRYMKGLRAVVTKVNDKSVGVEIIAEDKDRAGRFAEGEFRCPKTLLDRAPEEARK